MSHVFGALLWGLASLGADALGAAPESFPAPGDGAPVSSSAPDRRSTPVPLGGRTGHQIGDSLSARADSALSRLRAGDHAGARRIATELLQGSAAERRVGRRILATARFLEGDVEGALEEWNRLDEPVIHLVRIEGVRHTRQAMLQRRLALRRGEMLTTADLVLARRRLADLPAIARARLDYRPRPDGDVDVHAAVLERGRTPSVAGLGVQAVKGLVDESVALEAGPFVGAGDRWRLEAGWSPAQHRFGGTIAAAPRSVPGVVTAGAEWRSERYRPVSSGSSSLVEELVTSHVSMGDWVLPRVRIEGRVGLERWEDGTVGMLGSSAIWTFAGDAGRVVAHLDGWSGAARAYGRARLETTLEVQDGPDGAWRFTVDGTAVSSAAPRLLWPGAGTGPVRDALLRGHPLVVDGAIAGPAFAPRLAHATLERRFLHRVGPVRVGASVFVDAAAIGGAADQEGKAWADPGASVFAALGAEELTLSLARGDSGWVASARVGSWPR